MTARPWYREPMLALVWGLPLAAVIAGIATLVIAARTSDEGDPRVRRVAQTQTADLAPDRVAARLGLVAGATFDAEGVVRVELKGAQPDVQMLRLSLRHGTDPRRDRDLRLSCVDGTTYAGLLPGLLAAGAYHAELAPVDGAWRLVGRLEDGETRLALAPAVID